MKIPLAKLKAIIKYFCAHTESKYLGKTKLMKLFYYLDFTHVKRYGSPVTYDTYVHLEHGPIPSSIMNLIDTAASDIDHSILADTISIEKPENFHMQRIVAKKKFSENDKKLFSKSEFEIMSEVCVKFGDKNTKVIEDSSHKESPWNNTQLLEEIPYTLAADDRDSKVTRDEIELIMKIQDMVKFGDVFKFHEDDYVYLAQTEEVIYSAKILDISATKEVYSHFLKKQKNSASNHEIECHVLYCFVMLKTSEFDGRMAHLGKTTVGISINEIIGTLCVGDIKEILKEILRHNSPVPIQLKELVKDIHIDQLNALKSYLADN